MTKQKRATATVKMTYTEDTDLIAWWNSVPKGTRNAVMKDMMREYIEKQRGSYRPVMPRNVPQPFDPNRFTQISEDAAWIRTAMSDLPGYVERVIQHVVSMGGVTMNSQSQAVLQANDVSEDEARRREKRMKKAAW